MGRDSDFFGTVDVAVSMSELIDNVRGEGPWAHLVLNMSDMGELDADGLLVPQKSPATLYESKSMDGVDSARLQKDVHFGGRLWRLSFEHDTPLLSPLERSLPALMAGAGVLLTALISILVTLLSLRRAQAQSHADNVNAALLASAQHRGKQVQQREFQ